jgi:hypothetical protein
MKIIVINGQGGCGKDTFVKFCRENEQNIYNFSMVDGIKDIAKKIGWSGGKDLKDRKFLSDLKDITAEYNDFSFQDVLQRIALAMRLYKWYAVCNTELIFFIHAREPKDIERWVNDYGARALIVRRPEIEGEYGNHADDDVFEVEYDYTVWNTGDLFQLKDVAEEFMKYIRKEKWESHI